MLECFLFMHLECWFMSVSLPPAAYQWWVSACWLGSCRGCPWSEPSWSQRHIFWPGGWSGTSWSPRCSIQTGCGSCQSPQWRPWTLRWENSLHRPNHWPTKNVTFIKIIFHEQIFVSSKFLLLWLVEILAIHLNSKASTLQLSQTPFIARKQTGEQDKSAQGSGGQ